METNKCTPKQQETLGRYAQRITAIMAELKKQEPTKKYDELNTAQFVHSHAAYSITHGGIDDVLIRHETSLIKEDGRPLIDEERITLTLKNDTTVTLDMDLIPIPEVVARIRYMLKLLEDWQTWCETTTRNGL
ncbi:hypothetical protein G7Y31_06760 [Corynebacterium lizhenjunii]|uniref:Uncharacterized protein n=1 Tax=Corynebacterium lizhenjunii TaxID=2709394 RepID=A0A7T0PAE7_9CORY|nr:hypothetical protein [Corynebacterium lizhenjunii]QPK78285.1 hypothetical protein G7Y31_06760 [Corynebacterium lizhenjunii]